MRTKHSRLKLLAGLSPIFGVLPTSAVAQHVHGVVELGVVVEGDTVAVSLSAPLSDVVGFEHEPKTDEQAELIQQAASTLSNPDAMFGLAEAVNCEVSSTAIDGPAYVVRHLEKDGETQGGHESHHDHDGHHHEHEAHDHEHDAHEHEHDSREHQHDAHDGESGHEEHAEIVASYEWQCGDVAGLDSIDLRFTESFTGVETIKIQILTSAGAQVLTAEGGVESISLSSP